MQRENVNNGDVVCVRAWGNGPYHPALVWQLEPRGAYVYTWHDNSWINEWCNYEDMRVATAEQKASMKLVRGGSRTAEFGRYRYMVLCASPLGAPDTIAAGCRRWTSFRTAFDYYNYMGSKPHTDAWYKKKAAASKAILQDLKYKYDRALEKQAEAIRRASN